MAKTSRDRVEWVGALVRLPAYVTGEGEPYRPEALFWLGAKGHVLGTEIGKPGEVLGIACESLRSTIARPMTGRPHAPDRLRVASRNLADTLCAEHPGIEIRVAPTPEIDAMLAMMREDMDESDEDEQSYLASDIGADAVAALFRAAAALFRAQPWNAVPDDQSLIAVDIDALGIHGAAMSLIGQLGENRGLLLFPSHAGYLQFIAAAAAIEQDEEPVLPPHLALNFERGADLPTSLRREATSHGWELASAEAYPWMAVIDSDIVARPLTARELQAVEAIASALPGFLAEQVALDVAWNGGESVVRTLTVTTHSGAIEVRLQVPHPDANHANADASALLDALAALAVDEDGFDNTTCLPLHTGLLRRFSRSAAGAGLADGPQYSSALLRCAIDYEGETIATLHAEGLEEIVFLHFPRQLSVDASEAARIVDELRAFYRFLRDDGGLAQADDCQLVLGHEAEQRLAAALTDPDNFGPAKAVVMAGREAGFDMGDQDDVEEWMRIVAERQMQAGDPWPEAPRRPPRKAAQGTAQARRSKRKAARKARKRRH